jgi:hypothetical protein
VEMGAKLLVSRLQTRVGRILSAGVAVGLFACIDLGNIGPRNAGAFELQVESNTKQDPSSLTTALKGQARDPVGWLSVKLDGEVWDINPASALTSYGMMVQPVPSEPNQVPIATSTLTDTRVTLGMWDDWVRWTSRQGVSNYITPGTGPGYLMGTGVPLDNVATSQHVDTNIWKTGSTTLSLFAEYDRVGALFEAPVFAIKHQDPFSTPNSTTTRLGGAVQQGPITFTLEQRAQQSLAQDNAPINVENQIGVSLSFDELLRRSGWIPENMSWVMPASAYLTVGQGRVRAALDQGVNGDTTTDVSAGLSWNRDKIYGSLGFWQSDYQSQLYPWRGYGIDGSVGFHEGQWGVDLYFDVYNSLMSYPIPGLQQATTQGSNVITGGILFSEHF